MRSRFLILLSMLAVGCGGPQAPPAPPAVAFYRATRTEAATEIDVQLVGTFSDSLAYHNVRGVYRITDLATGRKYIGISGIGISEVGSHTTSNGKTATTVEDER